MLNSPLPFLLGVLLLMSPVLAGEQGSDVDQTLLRCEGLITAGDFEEAFEILGRLREKETKDARIPFLMSQCEFNRWRKDRKAALLASARKLLEDTFHLKQTYPEAEFYAGLLETEAGDWAAAERAFRRSIAGRYNLPLSRRNLAIVLLNRGQDLASNSEDPVDGARRAIPVFKEARARFESLRSDPRYLATDRREFGDLRLKAWAGLVAAQRQAGEREAAVKELRKLIEAQPGSPFHPYFMGLLQEDLNELEEAARWHEKALKLDERFLLPRLHLGTIRSKQNRTEEALRYFRFFLARLPDSLAGHLALGEHHLRQKEGAAAVTEFRRCVEIDNRNVVAIERLVEALTMSGETVEAAKWREKAAKLKKEAGPAPETESR